MLKKVILYTLLYFVDAVYRGPLAGGLPADLYPASVDPRTCPNYPECSNPAVAAYQTQQVTHYQRPVYQHRHTATPVILPQRYVEPEYEFVPANHYVAPQQQYVPHQYYARSTDDQRYTPEQKRALDRGEYIGDGDYHGEGLAEALASEYEGQQQSYQVAAPSVHYNNPAYQKVSNFLAQSRNVHQTPTNVW